MSITPVSFQNSNAAFHLSRSTFSCAALTPAAEKLKPCGPRTPWDALMLVSLSAVKEPRPNGGWLKPAVPVRTNIMSEQRRPDHVNVRADYRMARS